MFCDTDLYTGLKSHQISINSYEITRTLSRVLEAVSKCQRRGLCKVVPDTGLSKSDSFG